MFRSAQLKFHGGGLITDGDLRRTLQRHPPEAWASVQASAMATTNPISVTQNTQGCLKV